MKQNNYFRVFKNKPVAFILLFLPCIFYINGVIAHSVSDSIQKNKSSNDYFEKLDELILLNLSMNNDVESFEVKNSGNAGTYTIKPNDKQLFTFSLIHRWIAFSFSFAPKIIKQNNDDDLKGNTKTNVYAFEINFDHWVQNASYTRVKGYYLDNTSDYFPGWINGVDPYVQFPDLVYQSLLGQTGYKFNKNFSVNALDFQTERQLKSAGTLMPVLSYNYYIVDDKSPVTGLAKTQKQNNFEAVLSPGYFYTLVLNRNWYLSAAALPGLGFISTRVLIRSVDENITSHSTNPVFRFEGKIGGGYNGPRFFAGVHFNFSRISYNQQKTPNAVVSDQLTYKAFVGYRLIAPKKVKQVLDKAEDKLHSVY